MQNSLEASKLVEWLNGLEPGRLPLDVFISIARISVTSVIELVPLQRRKNITYVLLTRRDASDPVWPSAWHTPGTVIRPYDDEIEASINRLLESELPGQPIASKPKFVENRLHKVLRGTELAIVHWVEIAGDPVVGELFATDELPETLVDSQREFIGIAVDHYNRDRAATSSSTTTPA